MSTWHLVDPELRPALQSWIPSTLKADALPALREQRQQVALQAMHLDDGLSLAMHEQHIAGVSGEPAVRVRVIAPTTRRANRMGILHLHGGGHLFGSPEQSLSLTRPTAARHDCVVVSVDYRLSPEIRFPGSLNDSYAALVWMAENAAQLGIDANNIGLMGDSAGAGVAAALALLARDRGGPTLAFQNLMFPMLDDRTVVETERNPVTGEFIWTRENNAFGWHALLGCEPGSVDVSPYAAPARADDLAGLPPTWIGVGTLDLFLDEDMAYAQRLMRAGVEVELNVWPGAYHGFNSDPQASIAQRARETRQNWLARFNR
ncbi:alpha/beta hydrolase [Kosakonia sp. LAM2021]|uniref:alpha/beta hydrolase n=1 Tax=Kosakonia sp. LAM2021 TaxID=2800475 RepID=UPI00190CEDA3|nr:alpha/beta hydrolase [Kosakonia sp. LAM2021]